MSKLTSLICAAVLVLTGCDNSLEDSLLADGGGGGNSLSISVVTDNYQTKSVNLSNTIPNGNSIGLFMKNVDPSDLFQHDLRNLKFTASTSGQNQEWIPDQEVYLNKELCSIHAYYPYNPTVTEVTAIPVTTSDQADYMYSGNTIQVNIDNHTATLEMEHALSVITLIVKRGSYAGTGQASKIGINGNGVAQSALLNAETGKLYDYNGVNEMVSQDINLTLDEAGQTVHTLIVPNGETAPIRIALWVDGIEYSVVTAGTQFVQGSRYEYTVVVDEDEMGISNVHVGDWGYNGMGEPVLWVGNYSVTLTGDCDEIAFANTVSGSDLTIKAINFDGYFVNEVSISSGATLTQSVSGNTRVITLTNINFNVTVTFNGVLAPPAAIADDWSSLPDGVYAVRPDLRPANAADGNEACIGVALVNSASNQRLMIEKYEASNSSYATAASGMSSTSTFYWGGNGTDQSIANYTSSTNALTDYNGKANSEVLKTVTTGGDSYTSYATIGAVLNQFISNRDENQGHYDWYIPACGQLYLINQNKTNINTALNAIGGIQLTATYYWSSSEYNYSIGWYVNFNSGGEGTYVKTRYCRLRLVRDLL